MTDYLEEALGLGRQEETAWALEQEAVMPRRPEGAGEAGQREADRRREESGGGEEALGELVWEPGEAPASGPERLLEPPAIPRLLFGTQPADGQRGEMAGAGRAVTAPARGADARETGVGNGTEMGGTARTAAAAAQELSLLFQMRRAERTAAFTRSQRRAVTVTLPEGYGESGGADADTLDRAVERDARRYGGDFSLR